ncbi:MAG TPA: wax ester/triacylglycerol synthase domain-containing protein [Acidimicrobiales bacterium]|nr:wax ester/triacylglycerol synthase domain-containing protein [Acidimicrobiales bacterium]
MTGLESLMWRLGAGGQAATMSLVASVDTMPPRAALEQCLERVAASVTRLQQRVLRPSFSAVPPAWAPDPEFRASRHLEEVSPAADPAAVVAGVIAAPFHPDRPPWRAVMVGGSEPAVVFHLHHSYTDGLGGVKLLTELMDFAPDAERSVGAAAAPSPPSDPGPGLLQDLRSELAQQARTWGRALPWAGRTVSAAATDPTSVLRPAVSVAAALSTHFRAALGPSSPVLSGRSPVVAFSTIDLPLDAMRDAAARVGAKVNDVFLAGLLDGLARYHVKQGSFAPSLRLGVPISARQGEEELMRNQLMGAVLRGPLGDLDFDERMRLVREMMSVSREQPWGGLLDDLGELAARLPGADRIVAAAVASLDVLASNVTGPAVPMWLAGSRVTRMTPVGPRSGSAVNATLLSYDGTASIGLNIDPSAVRDPGVLHDCLLSAYSEGLRI